MTLRPVAFVVLSFVSAVPAAAQEQERAWIDFNIGAAVASEDPASDVVMLPFAEETATIGVDYNLPAGASLDIGGGWMLRPRFGVGITLAGTAHEDLADLSLSIPHPGFFNAHAQDSAPSDVELRRLERSINLHGLVVLTPDDARLNIRAFGGPTRFNVKQDVVDDIIFTDGFVGAAYVIDIVGADVVEDTEGSGWGFHVGTDVRYFFSPLVGVGAVVRFNRGEVDLPGLFNQSLVDENNPRIQTVKTGGLQIGGGLRFRF